MASNEKNDKNNYNYFDNFPVIIKPIDSKYNPFSIESNDKSNVKQSTRPSKGETQKTNSSKSVVTNKLQEMMSESMEESNAAYPWHKLLSLPTKQMVVIDRMHSGARRFITLSFGYLVKLTDVVRVDGISIIIKKGNKQKFCHIRRLYQPVRISFRLPSMFGVWKRRSIRHDWQWPQI